MRKTMSEIMNADLNRIFERIVDGQAARKKPRGRCPKCGRDCAVNADGYVYPHMTDGEYHHRKRAVWTSVVGHVK